MTRIFGILIAVLFLSVAHTASAQFSSELLKRAQNGDAEAQVSLGDLFYAGIDVVPNRSIAMKWYRLAAEQGNGDAQFNLGVTYYFGEGIVRDLVHSHMWFNIAASLGKTDAGRARDFVAGEMTPEQISKAQKLARECVRKEFKDC